MVSGRRGSAERRTSETHVTVSVLLDGTGSASISTRVPFLDHMLASLARHAQFDLDVQAAGDVHIDDHHTVEDTALTLGRAFRQALGDRAGIQRFGDAHAPMDECLALSVVDISGRPYCAYAAEGMLSHAGRFQTYLVHHFFRSFAQEAGVTLHVRLLHGEDPHHCAEAMFKSFALALSEAVRITGAGVPSTKGLLD